ncbi:hypothetical protein EDB19DRAFT_1305647 [Suillus lakei]|nr:hypothetical protein EDB19DRAFT_1305647 [Suillus lakei]
MCVTCLQTFSFIITATFQADATQCPDQFGGVDELSPTFFDDMQPDDDSSAAGGAHLRSPASAFLARLSSLLHRFRPNSAKLPQPQTPSGLHPHVLFARLSSLIHHSPPKCDEENKFQQPPTHSRLDPHALLARLSSLLPRSPLNADQQTEPHPTTPSSSRPDAFIDILSSIFRSQPLTNKEIELPQCPSRPHVVEVAAMRDNEVLFVAPRQQPDRPHPQSATPGARPAHSFPLRLLGHLGLFLCCVCNHQHADSNAQPAQQQQQGQSQGPVQAQASSLQTQPAAPSMSTTPIALDTRTTAPGAASASPRSLPLRTRFVLFLCCTSPPHADGH